jgi:hypothetical protein
MSTLDDRSFICNECGQMYWQSQGLCECKCCNDCGEPLENCECEDVESV